MTAADLIFFCVILALGQFSPGPDMILLTRTGLAQGRRAGWWMTAGIASGLGVHALLAVGGLQWLAAVWPGLWSTVPWLAAAYLGWLAFGLARGALGGSGAAAKVAASPGTAPRNTPGDGGFYLRGLLCNLLNPKALVFFAALVSPFLAGSDHPLWPWMLGTVIVVQGAVLWGLWVVLLQRDWLRRAYGRWAKWLDLMFAALLLALAVRLVVSGLGG